LPELPGLPNNEEDLFFSGSVVVTMPELSVFTDRDDPGLLGSVLLKVSNDTNDVLAGPILFLSAVGLLRLGLAVELMLSIGLNGSKRTG